MICTCASNLHCAMPDLAAGDARNTHAMAMSHFLPIRPRGTLLVSRAAASFSAPGASLVNPVVSNIDKDNTLMTYGYG